MSLHTRRRAFTLVEMLTVMAVISTLMAILLPAVNHVRELGRRTMCASNMRQLALACNTYHSIHNAFPCGQVGCPPVATQQGQLPALLFRRTGCVGPNWLALILVQLDEQGLAADLQGCANKTNVYSSCSTGYLTKSPTPAYLVCPSSPNDMNPDKEKGGFRGQGFEGLAKGNYVGCWGMDSYYNKAQDPGAGAGGGTPDRFAIQKDGIFGYTPIPPAYDQAKNPIETEGLFKLGHGMGTRIDFMKDGINKTIMISEVVGFDSDQDCRGAWFWGAMGASAFTAKSPPNTTTRDQIPGCESLISTVNRYEAWLACNADVGATANAAARSGHVHGVNIAMADSTTRFVEEDVDPDVWKAASTKNGKVGSEVAFPMPPAF